MHFKTLSPPTLISSGFLAAKLKIQLEEKAKDESEILIEKAKVDIEREKSAAIEEIRKNFSGIAIAAAEKIVESSLDEKTHSKLINKVLDSSLKEN